MFCKVFQEDELCEVQALEFLLKTKKSMDKAKATAMEELPTVKKVLVSVQLQHRFVTYQAPDL